ncbi:MAG: agmatinase family protein, partial [Thermomicrobiaceae bacterium]|nr:agmatinase family protein [Thermomicrobiaceae bacterium]
MRRDDGAIRREDLDGTRALEAEQEWPSKRRDELAQQQLEYGLESAATIRDRKIPLFARGRWGPSTSGRFMGAPFLEDMRRLGGQDVAILGVPLDTGTTYRSGTRFGPEAMRRVSTLGSGYNPSMGVDLIEALDMVDVGDVSVIPANIEKSFDQIALAVGYLHERAVFPVILGGDHSIGYPDIRGLAPYIDGNIGIIHFDRHSDLSEYNMDERMHGTPFFHATNIPNAPPENLVQIGIGGWVGSRDGLKTARERRATVITLDDVDRYGIDRVAEYALEIAWKNAKAVFLSFDIDSVDPAFAPGTGTPEPGGFLPREVLRLLRLVAREGLVGMEVVEVSPPYDVADITALLGTRVVMTVLGELVLAGKLGTIPRREPGEGPEGEGEGED